MVLIAGQDHNSEQPHRCGFAPRSSDALTSLFQGKSDGRGRIPAECARFDLILLILTLTYSHYHLLATKTDREESNGSSLISLLMCSQLQVSQHLWPPPQLQLHQRHLIQSPRLHQRCRSGQGHPAVAGVSQRQISGRASWAPRSNIRRCRRTLPLWWHKDVPTRPACHVELTIALMMRL